VPIGGGGLDLDWITGALAIGGCLPADGGAAARLATEHRITCVVDLRAEACDDGRVLRRHGIDLLHLPTLDHGAISERMIDDGVAWIAEARGARRRILVHCQHGIGRSALLVLCSMVAAGTATPVQALDRLKRARRIVSPSPDQLRAFVGYARRVRRSTDASWSVPTFDQLAEIAYRHLRRSAPPQDATTPPRRD
jgi:predicted protein tyrosine phosphatase